MDLKSYDYLPLLIRGLNVLNGCKWRFYLQVVLTEVKHGSREMNHLNKRAMELVFHVLAVL